LHLSHAVGEARAALVEHEHARELRKPEDVPDEKRLLPGRQEIARVGAHEDEVGSARTDDLVRDGDIAAPGVVDVWHVHAKSVPRHLRADLRQGSGHAARELPNLPLENALQLVHLYAERGSPKFE
jgi:hypothetical protein